MLSESKKFLDTAPLGKKYSFVLPLTIRNILQVTSGSVLGYYQEPDGKIIIASGGEKLLASAKLSSSNAMALPKDVRDQLKMTNDDKGKKRIGFYLEPNGKISLEITSVNI